MFRDRGGAHDKTHDPSACSASHRFVATQVRPALFILAYNLGNFLRRLGLPKAVKHWSLQSLQLKIIKMGAGWFSMPDGSSSNWPR